MYMTKASEPWEIVSVDFMGPFPRSAKGNTMLVMFQDKFSKWIEMAALREATTPALIKVFRERVYARYGSPKVLLSDNGRQFVSGQFKKLLRELNVEHRLTPPYSPQANPVERTNRVVKMMIKQYVDKRQTRWDEYIPELMLAYNTSRGDTTGFSPAYLNFGRDPLPLTSLFVEKCGPARHHYKTPTEKQQTLQEIYQLVRLNTGNAFEKQKHHYNLRRRQWCPKIGELVLRKERALSSAQKHFSAKLAPKYEGPYTVSKIISPVIVSLTDQKGKVRGNAHVKDLKAYSTREPDETEEFSQQQCTQARASVSCILTAEMSGPRQIVLIEPTNDPTIRKPSRPTRIPTGTKLRCASSSQTKTCDRGTTRHDREDTTRARPDSTTRREQQESSRQEQRHERPRTTPRETSSTNSGEPESKKSRIPARLIVERTSPTDTNIEPKRRQSPSIPPTYTDRDSERRSQVQSRKEFSVKNRLGIHPRQREGDRRERKSSDFFRGGGDRR